MAKNFDTRARARANLLRVTRTYTYAEPRLLNCARIARSSYAFVVVQTVWQNIMTFARTSAAYARKMSDVRP